MKSKIAQFRFLLFSLLLVLPSGMLQADDDDDGPRFVANQIVVKLNPVLGATIDQIHLNYGTTTLSTMLESAGIYLISIPDGLDLETLVDDLENDERLLYAEPNYITSVPQSDGHVIWAWSGGAPGFGAFPEEIVGQAPTQQLNLPSVHKTSTGAGSVVAVLDTGVDFAHPNLESNLLSTGYDFVDDDFVPQDRRMNLDADGDGKLDENFGHGTHVAGAVLLVAPDAQVLPVRVLDSEGQGNIFILAEAIDHAVRAGAHIINLSLGIDVYSGLLEDAIERAGDEGVLVVAAAGNANSDLPRYPAGDDDVLGVASVDGSDFKSTFSNWGSWIDVSAPGEAVISAFPDNTYAAWSGTSMAAPLVAGQAALIKAVAPASIKEDLTDVITRTAFDIDLLNPDWQDKLGTGRIDLLASLNDARYGFTGDPVEGSLAQLVEQLELNQDADLVVSVSGILGERFGVLSDDDDYLFSDGSGFTVLLDLDSQVDLSFDMAPGIQLDVIGKLETAGDDTTLPSGINHKLDAVWIRLPDGTALDIGPISQLAGSTISDWIGYFWELDDDGWYFHPGKAYVYSNSPLGDDGWFYSMNLGSWIYVHREWYPVVYSSADGWLFLVGNAYGDRQHGYRFDTSGWVLDFWRRDP